MKNNKRKVRPREKKCLNVILEGPDNSGKSTQIKFLLEKLIKLRPTHVIHYSAIPGLKGKECIKYSKKLYNDMFNIILNNDSNFILDRSHLGEFVYGYIYRKYDPSYIFEIEKQFNLNKIYLITLYDEPENLIKRDDGLSFSIKKSNKELEIQRFIEATYKSTIKNKYIININNLTPELVHKKIWNFIIKENK